MTREEVKSCIGTIEMLQRLAYNIHGVMDVIDADNCKKIIKALKQEHCEDAISRRAVLDTLDKMDSVLDEDRTVETYKELLVACYNDLQSVTPTHIETVTEFADKCRECGQTAITLAENDEILNEAWSLLMNATEEDGVTTEEANGMLKLMKFFFYKYHGLKKKPEWVENVEARIEREKADRVIRTISKLLPRDKEEDQNHKSEADKMKEVGEWFGQGIEKGLKNTEEENK